MFAFVARDELWILGAAPRPREVRLVHGQATLSGTAIAADDTPHGELVALCDRELETALAALPRPEGRSVTARVVVSARRAAGSVRGESAIALSTESLSLVTTPEHARTDCALLLEIAADLPVVEVEYRGIPIVWNNGTGSVLLHEAAGHPAEHGRTPLAWPEWLSVYDEPQFEIDDVGGSVTPADLLAGEHPSAHRRASFTDVPIRRLSNVVARQRNAPFEMPGRRIEVLLVAGGRYDPLTDDVAVFVSAARIIDGEVTRRAKPFVIREARESIARAIRGADGDPVRFPGVICSSEGQEIVVGSHAPRLLTTF